MTVRREANGISKEIHSEKWMVVGPARATHAEEEIHSSFCEKRFRIPSLIMIGSGLNGFDCLSSLF